MSQKRVKPFSEHGHYTSVHDAVFDVVMPFCPPNAFKVLMFVLRKTRGWKKEQDVLAYSQIKEGTGIRSDTTLAKELDWLVGKKLLAAKASDGTDHERGTRRAPAYSLNRDFELKTTPENGARAAKPTPENGVVATPENGETKNQTGENHSPTGDGEPSASWEEMNQSQRQAYLVAYLYRHLDEREQLKIRKITKPYKDRLAGELRAELKGGARKAMLLFVLDRIVRRWSDRALDFWEAKNDVDAEDRKRNNVVPIRSGRPEPESGMTSTAGYRRFE